MKHTCKRVLALLMTLVMTMSLLAGLTVAAGAEESGVTVEVSASPAEVNIGSADTVVMTVKTGAAVNIAAFNFDIVCPDGWTITAVDSTADGFSENCYDTANQKVLWYNAANVTTDTLATVTFTIPAGAAEGEYAVGVAEVDMGCFSESGDVVNLAAGASASTAVTVLNGAAYGKGDVNGDGRVNAIDAMLVLRAAAGALTLTSVQRAAADVNGDGAVNSADAQMILSYSIGKINAFGSMQASVE